jgi:hypothetical protein
MTGDIQDEMAKRPESQQCAGSGNEEPDYQHTMALKTITAS